MCRIFGFRSVLESRVHRSLMGAENALAVQSERHPDGWGVGFYVAGAPHIVKSVDTALDDKLFHRVSGVVTSRTVLAHVRQATQGEHSPLNSHPFQFGRWIFAHNGDVPRFPEVKGDLRALISPLLRRYVLGDTDSEVIFHLFLSHLSFESDLHRRGTPVDAVVKALRKTVDDVHRVAPGGGARGPLLTMVITDGEIMVGYQGGKELKFSTYKHQCPERDDCPFYRPECEAKSESGYVNHFILSSENLQGENVWVDLAEGEVAAVDHFMRFHRQPALS